MQTEFLKFIFEKEHKRLIQSIDDVSEEIDNIEHIRKLLKSGYYCDEVSGTRKIDGTYYAKPAVKFYISYRDEYVKTYTIFRELYDVYEFDYQRLEKLKRLINE